MGLMKRVLENRLKKPTDFYAAGATTMTQIIKAHKADGSGIQFRGFQDYPTLASAQQGELTDDLEKRDLVAAAVAVAKAPAPSDPSPGGLYFWRTQGHALGRKGYRVFRTVAGIDFCQKEETKKKHEKVHHASGPTTYSHGRPSSSPASSGASSNGPMTCAHGRPGNPPARSSVNPGGPMIYPNKRPVPR